MEEVDFERKKNSKWREDTESDVVGVVGVVGVEGVVAVVGNACWTNVELSLDPTRAVGG